MYMQKAALGQCGGFQLPNLQLRIVMESVNLSIAQLQNEIQQTRLRLNRLESQLAEAEERHHNRSPSPNHHVPSHRPYTVVTAQVNNINAETQPHVPSKWPLGAEDYRRYGRQMILPQIGLQGQLKIKEASVLIIGLGGLGCPAAAYLAGAGVGTLGLIDGDCVEISNLHRQIIHSSSRLGQYKVDSALQHLRQLNPLVYYKLYPEYLQPEDAVDLFELYDLILDCTDRPSTRYVISDAAILARKPVVSASALGMEGQLLTYNDPFKVQCSAPSNFCYRCVFPKPPPPETVLSCGEGGIFGPVVGVMGVLMATAALKFLVRGTGNCNEPSPDSSFGIPPTQPSMLLYSTISDPMFRTVRIKGKRENCPSCSSNPSITRESLSTGSLNYGAFCGAQAPANLLDPLERTTPADFLKIKKQVPENRCLLIDVRPKTEFELANIDGSISTPIEDLKRTKPSSNFSASNPQKDTYIFTICRHGNDSQLAAKLLQTQYNECKFIGDIKGGLDAWRREVDPTFPEY